MRKLSDYVETAAAEYWQETGKAELDSLWVAEFFQDCGVLDDHPNQDLVGFYALVQKALTLNLERAEKVARLEREKAGRARKTKC
ncbi:MAG TPA: hypothetical protein VIU46_03585 [Gallionellaceae bacterium]